MHPSTDPRLRWIHVSIHLFLCQFWDIEKKTLDLNTINSKKGYEVDTFLNLIKSNMHEFPNTQQKSEDVIG